MIGMTRSMSVTSASASQASSTSSRSAMSAIEHPALRSGRITGLVVAGEHVRRLGHEVHAAEHDVLGLVVLLGEHREAVAVATGVGPPDDLVALVVVAEDERPDPEGAPWRRSMRCGELVGGRGGVALVERSSAVSASDVSSSTVGSGCGRRGQPGRLSHGDVVPGTDMSPDTGPARPA